MKKLNNFWTRTLFGALYVAVVVSCILVPDPNVFYVLAMLLAGYSVVEYGQLNGLSLRTTLLAAITAVVLCTVSYYGLNGFGKIALLAYCILLGTCLIRELFVDSANENANDNAIHRWGLILQSQVMVALPFALMILIHHLSPHILLALFITIWINDSGAYCVGSLTAKRKQGNHKMFPRVSPNKSWEGLAGGIVFALAAGMVYWQIGWMDEVYTNMPTWLLALLFALVVAVFGTLGDLMESQMKRTLGVKDSGHFLPGHGGALDRFDSLLLATPAVLILLMIVG